MEPSATTGLAGFSGLLSGTEPWRTVAGYLASLRSSGGSSMTNSRSLFSRTMKTLTRFRLPWEWLDSTSLLWVLRKSKNSYEKGKRPHSEKQTESQMLEVWMAERGGFEPPVRLLTV